ncbi:MAG TPA: sorbosone dehydrogenase family protein [Verrucomicrobiae bacterium]|nr:sorbosone dehydrogenase family protein [Verrucomicrobiae bacterium]
MGVIHLGVAVLVCSSAFGADSLLKGQAALSGDWSTDAPGVRRLIKLNDLPLPYASKSVDNGPRVVPRPPDAMPQTLPGFKVDLLATGLNNPRKIVTAPNGDLFVAEAGPGRIIVLRQGPDGKIISTNVFAEHLTLPFGIAFYPPGNHPKYVYVANTDSVVRYPYKDGDLTASGEKEMIVPDIPGGGHLRGGGHWTRDIVFTREGKKMFVSVGSHSNVAENKSEDDLEKNRADILEYNPDGTGFRIYAWGIRNPVGLAIDSRTGDLWASVNERDGLGDNLPPDYITRVKENGFYGWPWFYLGGHPDPRHSGERPELGGKVTVPDVLLQAHSASLCLTFYTATQFPRAFRGGIFACEHGSWNRARRTGYKVIFVPVKRGKATGEYDDFLTGFVVNAGEVWGRPVGITVDSQGSLLVVDDGSNSIWRVRYVGNESP